MKNVPFVLNRAQERRFEIRGVVSQASCDGAEYALQSTIRCSTVVESEEATEAAKFAREGAGLLTSLTESDAFAELPEEVTAVAPGDIVRVLPFAAVF